MKNCPQCGKEFTPRRSAQKYCSVECREAFHKQLIHTSEIRICPQCGKEFTKTKGHTTYCSDECSRNSKVQELTVICKGCGREFKSIRKRKYCSDECRVDCYARKQGPCEEKSDKATCEICGKEFTKKSPVQKYCSVECRRKVVEKSSSRKDSAENLATCLNCGKVFPRKRSSQLFCSDECSSSVTPRRVVCSVCGMSFRTKNPSRTVCPQCRSEKLNQKKSRKRSCHYDVHEAIAIQQSLEKRYNRKFTYSEVSEGLEKGTICVDSISNDSGYVIANARLV